MLTTWSISSRIHQGFYHIKNTSLQWEKKSQNINTKKLNQETKPKKTN